MFSAILTEVSTRVAQVSTMVRTIEKTEKLSGTAVSEDARVAKGLIFVLLYALYEYCVTQSFQAALRAFNAHSIYHRDLRCPTLALALDDACTALRDRKVDNSWETRIALFEKSRDGSPATIRELLFPADGSHMRSGQLETVRRLLGIPMPLIPEMRFIGRINELVEHRNAIAHGRERPDTIGGRFTVAELDARVRDAGHLCQHIATTIQLHCDNPMNFR